MNPRMNQRPQDRLAFRLFVATAFLVATSPRSAVLADETSVSKAVAVSKAEIQYRAYASTVIVQSRRPGYLNKGAGVIVSADGFILTALHCVDGYDDITVITSEEVRLKARLVFAEEAYDIAMLKVKTSEPLEAASFADPSSVEAGKSIVAIGNPLGGGQSVVAGKLGETSPVMWDGHKASLPSVRAKILKGNSGGGTYDAQTGELLGINVAASTVQKNVGFMVPVDRLLAIIDRKLPIQELADAKEIYGQLGVRLRKVKLLDGKYSEGMLVTSVRAGSAAERAGWVKGDVLVAIDKWGMTSQDNVMYALEQMNGPTTFLVSRGDVVEKGRIELGAMAAMAASEMVSK